MVFVVHLCPGFTSTHQECGKTDVAVMCTSQILAVSSWSLIPNDAHLMLSFCQCFYLFMPFLPAAGCMSFL
uniref:Uncharacterized protein n=1 Tax=Hippocampus comes TaxID=109280 RepID=A0A3Q2XKV0_HIPCM